MSYNVEIIKYTNLFKEILIGFPNPGKQKQNIYEVFILLQKITIMIRCYTLNITILLSISILYAQDIKKDTKVIEQETIVSDTIKKKTEGPEILFNITSCDVGDAIQNTYLTY